MRGVLALALGVVPAWAIAGELTVAWDPPSESLSQHIVLYRSADSLHVGTLPVGPGTTAIKLVGLQTGVRYYVSVVAVGLNGVQSVPSAEVNAIAPATSPLPPGTVQTFFAEGASGFFDYRLALLNTTATTAPVSVVFLREGGSLVQRALEVPAASQATLSSLTIPELEGTSFAATLTAPPGVLAERTMRWRLGGADGAHTAKALTTPSTQWYLAEGNAGFFDTFVLLANPGAAAAAVTVDFLLDGGGVVSRTYAVAPAQRLTIWTNQIAQLSTRSFATTVRSSQPILVERAMYFRGPNGSWEGGHSSAGVRAGANTWFLAEGSTGNWFETFVLISNPNATAVTATIRYLTPQGVARTETRTLPPTSRTTIPVDTLPGLQSTEVSCSITATGNIIVERSMYWPGVPGPWYGGHNSVGVTALATRWGLAEGEVGGADGANSFVLVANPGTAAAHVTLTFRRASAAPISVTRTVGPGARVTVAASTVGLASGEHFGVEVSSTQPIAVERSMYWNFLGSLWTSGTNETGIPLP